MSHFNRTGLLAQAEAARRACIVAMDNVQFVAFDNRISAIGTRDLAGCSVVTVTSSHGAILAHIPPRPPTADTTDLSAGDRHAQELMDNVTNLYNDNIRYFPSADTYIVCAIFEGAIALPDQKKIIEHSIKSMGLLPLSTFYVVPRDPENAGQGTVLVDAAARRGHKPAVYVEDKLVSQDQAGEEMGSSASEWVWDDQYKRYRRLENGKWIWA